MKKTILKYQFLFFCRKHRSPYEKINRVLEYLERSPTYSSDLLDFESYELEPPENSQEKDLYKELKTNFKKCWAYW